jgi:hypothetical protein
VRWAQRLPLGTSRRRGGRAEWRSKCFWFLKIYSLRPRKRSFQASACKPTQKPNDLYSPTFSFLFSSLVLPALIRHKSKEETRGRERWVGLLLL